MNTNQDNNDLSVHCNSIRDLNHKLLLDNNEYQKIINEINNIKCFIEDYRFISFDRDFIICKNHCFSINAIMTSLELTVDNIYFCMEYGCFADANSLLRKYRDDLFFYLYIVVYDVLLKIDADSKILDEMEKNIEKWLDNNLSNLNVNMVLKSIAQISTVNSAVIKYDLKTSFKKIMDRLNNYVHSNGVLFYNKNIISYKKDELLETARILSNDIHYITVTFTFLLILCNPLKVMSTEYIDSLDIGVIPPDESQYWIAPFIKRFLFANLKLIDDNCINYLRENSDIKFD